MKKSTLKILAVAMVFFMGTSAMAQIAVTISPAYASAFDEITLTLDARLSCPDSALFDVDSVMMHSGVTINDEAWQLVVPFDTLGMNGQQPKLISNGDSTWSITFTPSEFYGIEEGTVVTDINCVFNGGDWSAEGKDFDGGACVDFKIALGSVGIFEGSETSTFKLFPNPVENELNINGFVNISLIEVYSVTGQLVRTVPVESAKNISINVAELNKGIYIVNIHTASGIQTTKFVKN